MCVNAINLYELSLSIGTLVVDLYLSLRNDEVPYCFIDVNRKPWSMYKCSLVLLSVISNNTLTNKLSFT